MQWKKQRREEYANRPPINHQKWMMNSNTLNLMHGETLGQVEMMMALG
jgi:hypothetical protein